MTILQVADHHTLDLSSSYDHMDRAYAYGYQEPRYPVPANIGYVSLGQDYAGVVYIDSADVDAPEMVYHLDCWSV